MLSVFLKEGKSLITCQSFPGGSDGKESVCNAEGLGWIRGLGRSPGGRYGNPLQYSCLENPHGQCSLGSYSTQGCKELDMNEHLRAHKLIKQVWGVCVHATCMCRSQLTLYCFWRSSCFQPISWSYYFNLLWKTRSRSPNLKMKNFLWIIFIFFIEMILHNLFRMLRYCFYVFLKVFIIDK